MAAGRASSQVQEIPTGGTLLGGPTNLREATAHAASPRGAEAARPATEGHEG